MCLSVPPLIADTYTKVTKVIKSRSTMLSCPATGIPSPEIQWFHAGQVVSASDRILYLDGGRQLRVNNATETDTGNYRCLATNTAGRSVADMELLVLGKVNLYY